MKNLREHYFDLAKKSGRRVAIGTGDDFELQNKCLETIRKAEKKGIKNILIIGKNLEHIKRELPWVELEENENPEEYMITLLKQGKIQGAVRGSLSAKKTVLSIKKIYKISSLLRFGPIDASRERTFMLGPLGIDEGLTFDEKTKLIKFMIQVSENLGLKPRIALMSLGRNEDVGRNKIVDKSIKDVVRLVEYADQNGIDNFICDSEILLENLDKLGANCILAPTGYIGNIMYRCLVHLGCGRSYGGYICGLPDAFIDTSRGGSVEEYLTAIAMAMSGV